MKVPRVLIAVPLSASLAAAGCGDVNAAYEELSQARHLAADLQVDFTKAADAANRAVMADADEPSAAYGREAAAARQAVHDHIGRLRVLLTTLRYSDEERILGEFESHFADYEKLDRQILDFAVENTNLKAQRLSFGEGQAAIDAFAGALEALGAGHGGDGCRVKAAAATALSAAREIQVLQAPHIAAPEDASMTTIETRMKTEETAVRKALSTLDGLVAPASRRHLLAANEALNRFLQVNAQVVALSRRNTNVHSVALSLNEKPRLIPVCQRSLDALRAALAHRGHQKGRWG